MAMALQSLKLSVIQTQPSNLTKFVATHQDRESVPQTPRCLTPNPFSTSFIVRMSLIDPGDFYTLQYIATHVFCFLRLPDGDDHSVRNDRSLAGAVSSVMRLYGDRVDQAILAQWHSISRMLDNLRAIVQFEGLDRFQTISQLSSMNIGGKPSSLHSILETHNA
jgi:hypothetical protein